jgi:hypothetical protein
MAYAMFYIVRNNFAPVAKEIGDALSYDKSMIGDMLAGTAIAYGLGKFVMGYFADRSDARKYIAFGMLLTAGLNFLFGATSNYWGHLLLWTLNGFVQGMGYGPCARGLSHWYSSARTRHHFRRLEHLAQHRGRHCRRGGRVVRAPCGAGNRPSTCPASSRCSGRFICSGGCATPRNRSACRPSRNTRTTGRPMKRRSTSANSPRASC